MNQKKTYFTINAFFLSTFLMMAQDYGFQKQIIKASIDPKSMLKLSNSLPKEPSMSEELLKVEVDPSKIKIPINSGFKYESDTLSRLISIIDKQTQVQMNVSPYFTMPYTNVEEIYLKSISASALNFNIFEIIEYVKKMPFYDDPVTPRLSKKEKTLKRIKKLYGVDD